MSLIGIIVVLLFICGVVSGVVIGIFKVQKRAKLKAASEQALRGTDKSLALNLVKKIVISVIIIIVCAIIGYFQGNEIKTYHMGWSSTSVTTEAEAYTIKGIIVGSIISLALWLITAFIKSSLNKREDNRNASSFNTKKCPFCANEIKTEAIVCQYCGKDLPEQK